MFSKLVEPNGRVRAIASNAAAHQGASQKWVFRYVRDGKAVEIGCGGADRVSLKMAREKREQYLDALAMGLDPRSEKAKTAAGRKTFGEVAALLIETRKKNWRTSVNEGRTSSLNDWTRSLVRRDCKLLANRAVGDIGVDDIKPIVKPHWEAGHEHTARRLLKRIETTLDFAKAHGWRKGDNPAAWGVFQHIFQASGPPSRRTITRRSTGARRPIS